MNVFDASSFSERMGNGRSSLCRVGEPVKGFTRSNHPAKCRKKKKGGIILKAKTKLTKLWSFLLSLVMLLSLLPTTALAASYPDAASVSVDGNKYFGEPGSYYFRNGESACSKDPTGYNAYYNPTTGTLTLDGYNGGSITAGGVGRTDITVVLKGTNTINGSLESAVGGDITVTSSDGGTLSISKTTSGSNSAIGIETGLSSSYTTGDVTIKGNAKVTINMTHNGTSTYEKAYGIFAKENITISENASVDITCATPNNTTGGGNCNGLYAAKDVTIDTNGTIKIDVTNAGKDKDNGYSYGVYHMGTATLTKVGNMEVQWKKEGNSTRYSGGAFTRGATFSDTDHAINEDTANCYASYRFGTPRKVTAGNGQLTGPGVKYPKGNGKFLAGDKVNITPDEKKGRSGEVIPFKEWTSKDVMLDKSATTASNSFTVPAKDVTVTATHSPFDGAPTFTPIGTTGTQGTLTFKTVVKADDAYEGFRLVKEGNENNESSYISIRSDTTSTSSPYEYSYEASIYSLNEGNYYVVAYLDNHYYLSEKFTVNYTAPVTTYTVSFNANGGTGTMADVTDISGEYTLPANGFTAPDGKQFKGWATSAYGSVISGTTYEVSSDTTFYAIWESKEYSITVTDGKATIGAGSEISKAAEGTAVTLTANAAPSGKVFDKWEVVSGGITLADANSATTTFTMPASAVSVKATYKNAPHTHTYNQETVKPEALKTPADCTGNAVYFKSCSCGAISTTDTFVAMNTALGHAYGSDWKYDSTNHWHECSRCHDKKYEAAHDYGSDNVCDTCGYAKTVTHTHNLTLVAAKAATCTTAGNSAYYTCDGCDKWFADATGSVEITDKTSVKIPASGHTAGTEWKSDDTNHWHECSRCHDKKDEAAHDYGSDNVCDTCGYYKTVPHTHNLTLVAAKAATCTEGGKEAYYKCEGCGKFYEDVLGTKEITDLASWGNIAKIAHTTKQTVTKATPTANGEIVNYCSVCKKTLSTTVIPNASSIKLKATSLTYNGKVRTPKVIVKDRTGKTLVKNTDYTVSYAKGRKYVGKYAVKITFKGKYSGTKTLYFTIKPKATSISSLKAGSKKFTVKWKKQATQTTGYQVQYSASSKFSKAKTVTVGKNTTVSKKISKLSGKKKYYVRVRTYKTVKINGKSIRIYSGWSKAKTVTTKK